MIGGVYLGKSQRDAITVDIDPSRGYVQLQALYDKAKAAASINGEVRRGLILNAVYEAVNSAFRTRNENAVQSLLAKYGVGPDQKIALDVFIAEGTGVCRHVSLACTALLEMFKKEGHIRGTASVDRNGLEIGAHAWCRYTSSSGEVFILDPMHGYIGSLNESRENAYWDYFRPEDR
ncbi:MAG: hypothetical protein WC405_19510 [Syntrophales bacterium]